MGTNPSRTVELLNELEKLGFNDECFQLIHHDRTNASVKSHRDYCQSHESFRERGNNSDVQRRLELVLNWVRKDHDAEREVSFPTLCMKAVDEIPFQDSISTSR